MKKLYTLLLLIFMAGALNAQGGEWEVGPFLGWAVYQGDMIAKTVDLKEANVAFGFTGRYRYYYTLNFRGSLLLGQLTGADANYPDNYYRTKRNFKFETSIVEISFMAEYEPLGKLRELKGGKSRLLVSPYLLGGLGFTFANPKPKFPALGNPGSLTPVLQDVRAGYSNVHLAIPIGAGIRYDVNRKWMIGAEIAARYAFTDYLDGISKSGNPDANDWYWFYGLTAMYKVR